MKRHAFICVAQAAGIVISLCLFGPGSAATAAELTPFRVGEAAPVGHSWAGTVVSEAGVDPKVSALVYVAARAPDAGEDYTALAAKFPAPAASAGLVKSGGFAQLRTFPRANVPRRNSPTARHGSGSRSRMHGSVS